MEALAEIYGRAVARHGGEEAVESRLPAAKSARQLRAIEDDRYLAEMSKSIFRSGFVWKVVEAKWPGFEEAFSGFDPERVASLGARELGKLAQDARVIRNPKKIQAVRDNATFVLDTAAEHGSFGKFLAAWPAEKTVGLWLHLKEHAQRLGGDTGPMFLRGVGKDTFMLSRDVVASLVGQGIVKKKPTSKRDLEATQDAFNTWAKESGRPLCQISRILALSTGEVY